MRTLLSRQVFSTQCTILDLETFKITSTDLAPQFVAAGLIMSGIPPLAINAKGRACYLNSHGEHDHDRDLMLTIMAQFAPDRYVIGHRICYDLGVLLRWFPTLENPIWDAIKDGRVLDTRMTEAEIQGQNTIDVQRAGLNEGLRGDLDRSLHLSACIAKYQGGPKRSKTADGSWSVRFEELYWCPPAFWPEQARRYLCEDLLGTHAVAKTQNESGGLVAVETETLDEHLAEVVRRARTLP